MNDPNSLLEISRENSSNLKRVPVVIKSDICASPEFIKMFDGYRSLEEIVKESSYLQSEIEDFVLSNIQQNKMAWKDEWSPLYWCDTCNLPLMSKRCDCCQNISTNHIDLKYPCNPRQLMPHDEHMFRSAGLPWPIDYSMILNAYKLPDYWGWDLIYNGKNIGDIIQRHENGKFEFVPSPDCDLTDLGKRQVSMEDLVKANATRLSEIEKEAVAYINSYREPFRIGIPILGFSGGKDSIVLAHIAAQSKFRRIFVYQINTGIEPEYNENFGDAFLKSYNKFVIKKSKGGEIFWKAIRKMGPHALDYQWCRVILKNWSIYRDRKDILTKLVLFFARFVNARGIVLNGARNREEPERVSLPRSISLKGNHPAMPGAPAIAIMPLSYCTDLDIWMYIHSRNLPVNPCYTKDKNQRNLCMFCFEKNDYEFEIDMKAYPDTYARLEAELKVWQKKFNFPDEWITKRLWRYNESNSSYMNKLKIVPRVGTVIDELQKAITFGEESTDGTLKGKIHIDFNIKDMENWFKAIGKSTLKNNVLIVKPDYKNIVSELGGSYFDKLSVTISDKGAILIESSSSELLQKMKRLVYGWALIQVHCISCGGCCRETDNIAFDGSKVTVQKKIQLKTVESIFKLCPMHPDGMKSMSKPLDKQYLPTSCTSCHIRYNKDMNFVNPVDPDAPK